jgi:hypothetical protein
LHIWSHNQFFPIEIALPSLTYLELYSRCMTDAALIAIGERCTKLETLRVFMPKGLLSELQITDVGVRAVLQGCLLLRVTDVEYAVGISTELRLALAKRCNYKSLYSLQLTIR